MPQKQAVDANATTVLVVDDEAAHLASLEKLLRREGMRALLAGSARSALEMMRSHQVDIVLTDLMMPGTSGIELLGAIKQISPDTEVVLMTAYGTVETAVQAMREGAYDFIEKPLKRMSLMKSLRKAAERRSLLAENRTLRRELSRLKRGEIVGNSQAIRRAVDVATQAAPSSATVLVLGESGTGKELLARLIHDQSHRADGPFVAVNCAAIPEPILESELFGHERGAFTGAVTRREGRFARAAHGTLFLDEIAEISLAVQVKLLRVLQEGEYEPVGGETTKADVRIVAATNRDLQVEVAEGRFREDLYYRLNVIAITAPPLRVRRGDIPLLVDHFLGVYAEKNGRPRLEMSREALRLMTEYDWPGNVRELENAVERAVVLCRGDSLSVDDLPEAVRHRQRRTPGVVTVAIGTPLVDVESQLIRETLQSVGGNKSVAAQLLGISTRTIYRKLEGIAGEG